MGSSTETVTGMGYAKMFDPVQHAGLDLMMRKVNQEFGVSKTLNPAFVGQSLLQIRKNFNYKLLDKLDITSIGAGKALIFSDAALLTAVKAIDATATTVNSYVEEDNGCNVKLSQAFMYEEYGVSNGVCGDGRLSWNGVTYDFTDCNAIDANGDKIVRITERDCAGVFSQYLDFPATNSNTLTVTYDTSKTVVVFKDDAMTSTNSDDKYMAIDYKLDGETNVEKYLKIANSLMGMSDGTLDETLSDDKLEDFFLGYAVQEGVSDDYDAKIAELMGEDGYSVEWEGNSIVYGWNTVLGVTTPYMEFNGARMQQTDEQRIQYMIPLNWLFKRTMRQQYDDLKELSTFFAFTSEEVEIAWYQSGFFQILMIIAAIVLAAYGYPEMLYGMITARVVQTVFGDTIIGDILLIVIAIYTLDASNFATTFSTFSTVVSIANQIQNTYYKHERREIANDIDSMNEQAKAEQEVLAGLSREMLYIPLDVQDMMNDAMYEQVYAMYNTSYTYDSYFSLRIKPYQTSTV